MCKQTKIIIKHLSTLSFGISTESRAWHGQTLYNPTVQWCDTLAGCMVWCTQDWILQKIPIKMFTSGENVFNKLTWFNKVEHYLSKLRSVWHVYLRSMLSASVMVLQRFSRASRRWGSSFRNLTASTSTLSTTRILLCRLGNWSAWERKLREKRQREAVTGRKRRMGEQRKWRVRGMCWDVDVWKNEGGEWGRWRRRQGGKRQHKEQAGCCFCHRYLKALDFPVILRQFQPGGFGAGRLNESRGYPWLAVSVWTCHSYNLKCWTLSCPENCPPVTQAVNQRAVWH